MKHLFHCYTSSPAMCLKNRALEFFSQATLIMIKNSLLTNDFCTQRDIKPYLVTHLCNLNAGFCFSVLQTHYQRGPSCHFFCFRDILCKFNGLCFNSENGKHQVCDNNYLSLQGSNTIKSERRVVVIDQIHQKSTFILKISF